MLTTAILPALVLAVSDPRTPSVSPGGGEIVLCHRGDVWEAPSTGGTMRCLTPCASVESSPRYSPDGSMIAFTSDRTGGGDVYVMPSGGGTATRLTWYGGADVVAGWSAGSDSVLFTSGRDGGYDWLYAVAASGGTPVPRLRAVVGSFCRTPAGLAVERGFTPWWRRHYDGSASSDIWLVEDGSWRQVLSSGLDERWPMWCAAEGRLLFVTEDGGGNANLHALDPDGTVEQLTMLQGDITFPSVSADGSLVCFEHHGALMTASSPGWEPVEISLEHSADLPFPIEVDAPTGTFTDAYDLESDLGQVALVSEGEIFCGRMSDGAAEDVRRLTRTPGREGSPAWSPDGSMLVFTREWDGRSTLVLAGPADPDSGFVAREVPPMRDLPTEGSVAEHPVWSPVGDLVSYLDAEASLRVIEPSTGRDWQVCPVRGIIHHSWSPDGRWLAFSVPDMAHREDVFVVPATGGEPVNVSRHPNDDFQPFWPSDGRRLIFASRTDEGGYSIRQLWLTREDWSAGREEREALLDLPVETVSIEYADMQRRTETLCTVEAWYDFFGASPDGRWIAFKAVDPSGGSDLWAVDWTGTSLTRLSWSACDPVDIRITPEQTVYFNGMGGVVRSVPVQGGPERILGWSSRVSWTVPERQLQKFDECWRLLRDNFYDPAMHGVDWDGVRLLYRERAGSCLLNSEFNDVVSRMLGELSASHLGVYGPWEWSGSAPTGELGVLPDYSWEGEGIRVDSIVPWSPADLGGSRLEPGDLILTIDGERVGARDNLYRPLARKTGEEVVLGVRRNGGYLEVVIEPVSSWEMQDLCYHAWLDRNRRITDRMSGGRVGYLHIPAMNGSSVEGFLEDLFAEGLYRDGMIIDIRDNGGGSTHDEIIRHLSRPSYLLSRSRDGRETLQPLGVWQKPLVLLINERCYSDAEIMPAGWKALGIGPVVGSTTYGAVIGTNDIDLVDGTGFRLPSEGWFTLDGTNLENSGVTPDVTVVELPADYGEGVDRQLEAAVRAILPLLSED